MQALRKTDKRIRVVLYLLVLGLLTVTIRLFFLQVARASEYGKEARGQRVTELELPARRGAILDRNGEILVDSREAETVFATPYLVKNPKKAAKIIGPVLSMPVAKVESLLKEDSGFVYLARQADPEIAKKLRQALVKEKIEGVDFIRETKRYYPYEGIGAQIVGFCGVDGQAQSGVELQFDKYLKGKPGRMVAELDRWGHQMPGGLIKLESPVDGSDVRLTIDKDIQYKVQQELEAAVKKWKAAAGTVIVMNPQTGEIYAIASYPTFNPNDYSARGKPDLVRNRAITDTYEPGSTMKVFTASAALEEGLFRQDDTFELPPTIEVGGRVINEAHGRATRSFTFSEIVQESSNVGAVTIGLKLGKNKLCEYTKKFGLDEPTGIDLPGETSGYIPHPDDWSASTIGNVPFGQGLAVTPIGILRGFSALANGGILPEPHVLVDVTDKEGNVLEEYKPPKKQKRAVSPETVGRMRDILEKVVTAGTGGNAEVEGYRVAGKTGTAQKPKPGVGYASGDYVGSFIGYLPSRNPQLAIVVALDEPSNAIYGGVVAAPSFSNIAEYSLRKLRIPPQ